MEAVYQCIHNKKIYAEENKKQEYKKDLWAWE